MVVFTCGYCGESIQKPKVEKHYLTKCRNRNPNLSCMDCFKDFYGNEYEAHTKCITEEQRYSGKGFVAKTPKGEQKQGAWVEMISQVLEEQKSAPEPVLKIIQEVSKHNNTPRKKPKFINFVKNICGQRTNPTHIEAAWNIISVKLSALSQANKQQETSENQNGGCETETSTSEGNVKGSKKKVDRDNKNGEQSNTEPEAQVNGKDHKSASDEDEVAEVSKKEKVSNSGGKENKKVNGDCVANDVKVDKKSKKQKKKSKELNGLESEPLHQDKELQNDTIDSASEPTDKVSSKKKNKKLKQIENGFNDDSVKKTEETAEVQNDIIDTVSDDIKSKKKSKKNKKKVNVDEKHSEESKLKEEKDSVDKPDNLIDNDSEMKDLNSQNPTESKDWLPTKTKRQIKEEKKKKKYEEEMRKAAEVVAEEEEDVQKDNKKGKKRKNAECTDSNADVAAVGKPKKKMTKTNDENVMNLHEENVASEQNFNKEKFNWDDFIISSLKKRGNEMAYNRLQKKVIAAYAEITGKEPNEKMVERLGKKIILAPRVKVVKDKVILED